LSKDWRDPGDQWVRFDGGWEKRKTLSTSMESNASSSPQNVLHLSESPLSHIHPAAVDNDWLTSAQLLHQSKKNKNTEYVGIDRDGNFVKRNRQSLQNVWFRLHDNGLDSKPFCQITLKNTPEVAGANGLAEALIRLDFVKAVSDLRRFSYVTNLMHLLFSHDRFRMLSGAAQRILFKMMDVVADQVYHSKRGDQVLKILLEQIHTTLTIYHVWGSHLGSTHLFKQHVESRRKITELVEKMQTEFKQDLATPGMVDHLPEECIREILLRLDDQEDIERAGNTCTTMSGITKEKRIWKELVQTQFTRRQIDYVVSQKPQLGEQQNWQEIYKRSRRKFGLRESYTEMLNLCRKCQALFWASIGHPCLVPATVDEASSDSSGNEEASLSEGSGSSSSQSSPGSEHHIPVTPATFITFFSV